MSAEHLPMVNHSLVDEIATHVVVARSLFGPRGILPDHTPEQAERNDPVLLPLHPDSLLPDLPDVARREVAPRTMHAQVAQAQQYVLQWPDRLSPAGRLPVLDMLVNIGAAALRFDALREHGPMRMMFAELIHAATYTALRAHARQVPYDDIIAHSRAATSAYADVVTAV
jgi:hypothetical protein